MVSQSIMEEAHGTIKRGHGYFLNSYAFSLTTSLILVQPANCSTRPILVSFSLSRLEKKANTK